MRRVTVERNTSETQIKVALDLDGTGARDHRHAAAVLHAHARRVRAPRPVRSGAARARATSTSTATTSSRTSGSCSATPSSRRSATSAASSLRRVHGADGRDARAGRRSISPGGPRLVWSVDGIDGKWVGGFDCELAHEFFQAFANRASATCTCGCTTAQNAHHIIEALFKAFARATSDAVAHRSARRRRRAVDEGDADRMMRAHMIAVVDAGLGQPALGRQGARGDRHAAGRCASPPIRRSCATPRASSCRGRARSATAPARSVPRRRSGAPSPMRSAAASRTSASASACRCCSSRVRRVARPSRARRLSRPRAPSAVGAARRERAPLKVPHIGWSARRACAATHPVLDVPAADNWFYFVHSYHALPEDQSLDRRGGGVRRPCR